MDGTSELKIASTNLTFPQHWADSGFIDAITTGKSKIIGDTSSHTLLKKSVSGAICKKETDLPKQRVR
jgi:hypothetical protein